MATDAGELIIKISADVAEIKNQLQQVADKASGMSATTVAKGTIMADAFEKIGRAAITFVQQSIEAFAEEQAVMTRLALQVGGPTAQAFKDFAEEQQKMTSFSDDAVLSLEAQLSQYGIYPGSVKAATKAALDFASVTGKDLPTVGEMFAKAMSGQSRELKQYGLDLSTAASRSDNLAKTIAFLDQRFGGAAETMKGTFSGSIKDLQNQFSDFQKKIGAEFVPVLQTWVGWLNKGIDAVRKMTGAANEDKSVRELGIQKLREERDALEAKLKTQTEVKDGVLNEVAVSAKTRDEISQRIAMIGREIKALKDQKDVVVQTGTAKKKAASTAVGATETEIDSIKALQDQIIKLEQEQQNLGRITQLVSQQKILQAQIELAQMQADEMNLTQTTAIETQKRLEQSQLAWETNASYSDQLAVKMQSDLNNTTATFVDMTLQTMDAFYNSTAKMIVEGGRFRDVVKDLWKNLAEAVIAQIERMIAEWLILQAMTGGAGGGLGGVLGGFATGGMVNEPSIITGMRSGRSHFVAENGPEMIVPSGGSAGENKPFGPGEGPGGGGGGGVTINISGQFLEGSASKWQKIVREQIVPQVRRYTMSTPVGPFNRKRGAS